jgi:hypothetical protein
VLFYADREDWIGVIYRELIQKRGAASVARICADLEAAFNEDAAPEDKNVPRTVDKLLDSVSESETEFDAWAALTQFAAFQEISLSEAFSEIMRVIRPA